MPAVQTVYTPYMRPGVEGQIATEWGSALVSETRICETAAGIGFGKVVTVGAGVNGAVLGGAVVGMLGVTIRDITLIAKLGQTVDKYQLLDNMAVLNEGDIWVIAAGAAVVAGTVGTYLAADGTFAPAATPVNIPGSRWMTSAAQGALAVLRLTRGYHTA